MKTDDHTRPDAGIRFRLLDAMRGIAAMWVFVYHFPWPDAYAMQFPWLLKLFEHGHLGVPMFFVISGFCMAAGHRSTTASHRSPSEFLVRRLWRIYPPLWCSIVVIVMLPYLMAGISWMKSGDSGVSHPQFLDYSWLEWLGVATLTQVFNPAYPSMGERFASVTAVFWTLAIEIQFYLVMAICLTMTRRLLLPLLGVTIFGIAALFVPGFDESGLFLPYWPMFAAGILLYVTVERSQSRIVILGWKSARVRLGVVTASAGALICAITTGAATISDNTFSHTAFCIAFAFMLWIVHPLEAHALSCEVKNPSLKVASRLLFGLGVMSYSLYLLHSKLVLLAAQFVRQIMPIESWVFMPVTVALTVLMCAVFHRFCEVPFMKGASKRPVRIHGVEIQESRIPSEVLAAS